jgi:hypothetical protein
MGILFIAIMALLVLGFIIFAIFLWWRICSKAGYSGAMGLLMLVPFGELILLCILAFGHWPTLRELEQLRQTLRNPPRPQ